MSKIRPKHRQWLPPWQMPSDPVKALWWFLHWLLKVVVRYCWLLIAIAVLLIAYNNGTQYGIGSAIASGLATLLVSMVVWGILAAVLQVANIWVNISQVVSDAQRMQGSMFKRYSSGDNQQRESNVVEGSVVEMEEERAQQQRQE